MRSGLLCWGDGDTLASMSGKHSTSYDGHYRDCVPYNYLTYLSLYNVYVMLSVESFRSNRGSHAHYEHNVVLVRGGKTEIVSMTVNASSPIMAVLLFLEILHCQ